MVYLKNAPLPAGVRWEQAGNFVRQESKEPVITEPHLTGFLRQGLLPPGAKSLLMLVEARSSHC